ncbi:MAG: HAD family hydrolase [Microbacteriaceae bacterium]
MVDDDVTVLRAVLFDIDGTLVDSNYLHVDAWQRAFDAVGHPVDAWRIHRAIGMDSGTLLDAILGDDRQQVGERAKRLHAEHLAASASRLRTFPGARQLLTAVDSLGIRVTLCTSAPPDELTRLLTVLDADDVVHAVTSADDVDQAKPDPHIIHAALSKAGVSAEQAVMLGDTVWDAIAAGRAGVPCVGVMSGGISAADLVEAGAIAVYEDVADLLRNLEASPFLAH